VQADNRVVNWPLHIELAPTRPALAGNRSETFGFAKSEATILGGPRLRLCWL
jgi:hypothetical protein